jgi:hypothetical protein
LLSSFEQPDVDQLRSASGTPIPTAMRIEPNAFLLSVETSRQQADWAVGSSPKADARSSVESAVV